MGVSTTPVGGLCTLSLLTTGQEPVRDFSSYFVYHQGKRYITRLIYLLGAHFRSPVSCQQGFMMDDAVRSE